MTTVSRARAMPARVRVIAVVRVHAVGVAVGHHQVGGIDVVQRRRPGEEGGRVPVGPEAEVDQVGPVEGGHQPLVGGGRLGRRAAHVHRVVAPHRAHRVEQGRPDHPVVGVGVVGRHAALVAQVDVHVATRPGPCPVGERPVALLGRAAARQEEASRVGARPARRPPGRRRPRAPTPPPRRCRSRCPHRDGHWSRWVCRPPLSSRSITGLRHSSPDRSTSRSAMWGPQVPAA